MRKTFYLSLIVLFTVTLLLPSIANAHPGRTDSNGGHTCRTNCEKWGLKDGEYHYHNGGGSGSGSNTSTESNPDSSSGSGSKSNSNSGSNSKSNSGSNNNSNSTPKSGTNSGETTTSKPKPQPEPVIDKKQIKADEHYKKAKDYYNKDKFQDALEELGMIYELDRNDSNTAELVQKSLNDMYSLAEESLNDGNYDESNELLNFILDYERSDDKMSKKTEKLQNKLSMQKKIANLLSDAKNAKDKENYSEALSLLNEANKVKETKEVSQLFDSIMSDMVDKAKTSYLNNDFEKSSNLYKLIEEHEISTELKGDYQFIIHQIEDLQHIQEVYELGDFDFDEDSLFNRLINEEDKETYNLNIVNDIQSFVMNAEQEEGIRFIFDMNINDFSTGGE